MKDVQTVPGADIDSDHNLMVAKICTRLKKIIQFQNGKTKMESREDVCSMTESVGYSRRKTHCNQT
jgi:hypothetical protein